MARLLKGAPVAAAISAELAERVKKLRERGVVPTLATVRLGERPADVAYERGAGKRCEKLGIAVQRYVLPEDCSREALLSCIREINEREEIHGCLMFRPLPDPEAEREVCALLNPEKDMDGITRGALGDVFTGGKGSFPPSTAQACMEILDFYGYQVRSARVTVIGASLVIGRPVGAMLLNRCATLTMCHIDTVDTAAHARNAEILISAVGCAGLVTREYVSPGQVVLDVGINQDQNGNICGDVCFDEVEPVVEAITPVPGGVGTVTSAVLAKHVVEAAERALERELVVK